MQDLLSKLDLLVVIIDVTGPNSEWRFSGIISKNGYVLTCYHVIDGAATINVTLNTGETISANVANGSKGRDIAVLKVNSTRNDLPTAVPVSSLGRCSLTPYPVSYALATTYHTSYWDN